MTNKVGVIKNCRADLLCIVYPDNCLDNERCMYHIILQRLMDSEVTLKGELFDYK